MTTELLQNDRSKFFEDIYHGVIGIDEVGRGALCGPVVSCSVLLNKSILTNELAQEINDSKKLTPNKRKCLSQLIKENSKFSFGISDNDEIDRINILKATILSMRRSFKIFQESNNKVKIDGLKSFKLNNNTNFIVRGDQKSVSIASASILAKHFRDSLLLKKSKIHPQYGWDKNKGYGTKLHINALRKFGITNFHRKTFLSKIIPLKEEVLF